MKNKLKICLNYMLVMFLFINTIKAQYDDAWRVEDNDSTSLQSNHRNIYDSYLPALPMMVHPTSTSMALQRYLGYPVSHATALVDISIPLYEFKEKFVSLPFELKYHSSGRRIQDLPGVIGHGWTLNPGLKISRTIYGKPDDGYPVRDLDATLALSNTFDGLKELIYMSIPASDSDYQIYPLSGDSFNKRGDGQYDIFTIHLPHRSASFILMYDEKRQPYPFFVQMIPESPLVIEPKILPTSQILNCPPISCNLWLYGFTVKDEFGNEYHFGEVAHKQAHENPQYIEHTRTGQDGLDVAIGWMLRKIIQSNGEEISFTYKELLEFNNMPQSNYQIIDDIRNKIPGHWINDQDVKDIATAYLVEEQGWIFKPVESYSNEPAKTKTISSISSNTKEMIFSYTDVNHSYYSYLSCLTVKDKLSNLQIKTIYFKIDNQDLHKRNLAEIEVAGMGKFLFEYHPYSRTEGFDWWGYCNGVTKGTKYVPAMQINYIGFTSNGTFNIDTYNGDNREPNISKMQSGALKKVTYPTGGSFEIEYQPHQAFFKNENFSRIVGGLRVSKTKMYDPVSNKTITKEYLYEKPHSTTEIYPTPESLIKTSTICLIALHPSGRKTFIEARSRIISLFSPHPNLSSINSTVWYEKVTEIYGEGKTIYTYDFKPANTNQIVFGDYSTNYYYHEINYPFYTAPRLLNMTHYGINGNKVQKVKHTYSTSSPNYTKGWIVLPVKRIFKKLSHNCITNYYNSDFLCDTESSPQSNTYEIFSNPIAFGIYFIKYGIITLSSTETVTYSGINNNDSIVEQISYTYDPSKKYNLRTKTVTDNTGDLKESYYYPYDNDEIPNKSVLSPDQQSKISLMDQKNYKTTVVQKTLEKGDSTLYSKIAGFTNISGNPDLFLPETDYFRTCAINTFEPRVRYHKYDSKGNPACVSYEGGPMIVYIWGYKGQYPVAKIETTSNLSSFYTTVTNAIGTTNTNTLNGNPTDKMVRTIFTNLRANSKMTNAFITSYTYKPLVGMTSETDPSGRTIFYEYDDFSRLIRVKDDAGKILKEYRYNYAQ